MGWTLSPGRALAGPWLLQESLWAWGWEPWAQQPASCQGWGGGHPGQSESFGGSVLELLLCVGAVLGAETQPHRPLQGLGGCQRSHVSCSSAGRGDHMLLL